MSLISQTDQDFEIILASDEGSYLTKEIANKYLRKQDKLLILPNFKGPSDTRNFSKLIASGKFITFLDDDDTFEPDHVENLKKINNESTLFYFNYKKIYESLDDISLNLISSEEVNNVNVNPENVVIGNIFPNNCFILPAHVCKLHDFDNTLQSHEDWDYLIKIKNNIDFKYLNIYGPNVHLSVDSTRNMKVHKDGSVVLDFLSIYRKWPNDSMLVKEARVSQLKAMGINLDIKYL